MWASQHRPSGHNQEYYWDPRFSLHWSSWVASEWSGATATASGQRDRLCYMRGPSFWFLVCAIWGDPPILVYSCWWIVLKSICVWNRYERCFSVCVLIFFLKRALMTQKPVGVARRCNNIIISVRVWLAKPLWCYLSALFSQKRARPPGSHSCRSSAPVSDQVISSRSKGSYKVAPVAWSLCLLPF